MTRTVRRQRGIFALVLSSALLLPVPAVAGTADVPDTCGAAIPITPGTAWTSETLGTAGDRDWYRFTLPAKTQVLITLGGLVVPASLMLQSSCGTTLATSDRPGVQYEELQRTLPAGTYHLRVAAAPGVSSARFYSIRVRPIPAKVIVLSSSIWAPYPSTFPDRPRVVGEVLNGTADARQDVKVRIRFYDDTDGLLLDSFTWARRERMRPGQRSMFEWYGDDVPGFDHVLVTIAKAPLSSYPPLTGLVAHAGGSTPNAYGGVTYWGTVKNTRTFGVTIPRVMVTVYDRWGDVQQAGFVDTTPDPMAAGSTNAYEVLVDGRATGNRVVTYTHGYRDPTG